MIRTGGSPPVLIYYFILYLGKEFLKKKKMKTWEHSSNKISIANLAEPFQSGVTSQPGFPYPAWVGICPADAVKKLLPILSIPLKLKSCTK